MGGLRHGQHLLQHMAAVVVASRQAPTAAVLRAKAAEEWPAAAGPCGPRPWEHRRHPLLQRQEGAACGQREPSSPCHPHTLLVLRQGAEHHKICQVLLLDYLQACMHPYCYMTAWGCHVVHGA
jgi:hypothetical protein